MINTAGPLRSSLIPVQLPYSPPPLPQLLQYPVDHKAYLCSSKVKMFFLCLFEDKVIMF